MGTLKEILVNIKSRIETSIPEFAPQPVGGPRVRKYHGEFSEGYDWTPVLPVCFYNIQDNIAEEYIANLETSISKTTVVLYVGDDDEDSIELSEKVVDALDGYEFQIDEHTYTLIYKSLSLFGYIRDVEIFKILIEVK